MLFLNQNIGRFADGCALLKNVKGTVIYEPEERRAIDCRSTTGYPDPFEKEEEE